jgi:hypothetical protein
MRFAILNNQKGFKEAVMPFFVLIFIFMHLHGCDMEIAHLNKEFADMLWRCDENYRLPLIGAYQSLQRGRSFSKYNCIYHQEVIDRQQWKAYENSMKSM